MILGGDFNAGCSYVSEGDWDWIRLRTDSRFLWVICDDANTNVAEGSECPYDRLVQRPVCYLYCRCYCYCW